MCGEGSSGRRIGWIVLAVVACGIAAFVGYSRGESRDPSAVFEPGVCAISDLTASIGFRPVPCTNPHDAEVVLVRQLAKEQLPVAENADAECFSSMSQLTQSRYSALGATPSAIRSASGRLVCLVVHPSRPTSIVAEVGG